MQLSSIEEHLKQTMSKAIKAYSKCKQWKEEAIELGHQMTIKTSKL